jgi:hypothetical protein
MTEKPYEQWLAKCREASPPAALADRIMNQVAKMEHQRRSLWWLRLVQRIERSRASRWAVCGGALAIGCLPFLFLAHVAKFVAF